MSTSSRKQPLKGMLHALQRVSPAHPGQDRGSKLTERLVDAPLRPCHSNCCAAPENLQLAQKYYQVRLGELVDLIQVEETKFKSVAALLYSAFYSSVERTVMKEIEDIKAGKWDGKLGPKIPSVRSCFLVYIHTSVLIS